jgi:DNA-binding LacI/PurR family transcriptional regulator
VRATSYDVAVAAGVSQPTVSRCFQPGSNISDKTRAHVLAVAERLGYTPNVLARSLITRQSHAVGVVITRYTLLATPGLLHALGDELTRVRKRLILLAVDSDEDVAAGLADVHGYPLDGLISCAMLDEAQVAHFTRHGVPVLFFNRVPAHGGVDSVSTHHAEGAARLAQALLGAGYRRFLCMGGPQAAPVGVERLKGFTGALAAAGLKPLQLLHTDFTYQGGYDAFVAAAHALEHGKGGQAGPADPARPDCIWCANDAIAQGVIDACRWELGWRVPEDVAVAGFDDVAEAARAGYRLTTVRQPIAAMAARAVQLLQERAADPSLAPRVVTFDGLLVERTSARLAG